MTTPTPQKALRYYDHAMNTDLTVNACSMAEEWAIQVHQGRNLPDYVCQWVAGQLVRHWAGECNCPKKARNLP